MKTVFTGGTGLLGRTFKRIRPEYLYPTRQEMDVSKIKSIVGYLNQNPAVTQMIHAAALTGPPLVEKAPKLAIEVNILGTLNMVKIAMERNIKLIYISTDYVFSGVKGDYSESDELFPVNKYAWSKLGGECAVRLYDNSLIVRTTFGPDEFPYDGAFVDQWTSRESVSVITTLIADIVDMDITGVIHVGGKKKTVYEYARGLSPEKTIKKINRDSVNFRVPRDTSFNTGKMMELIRSRIHGRGEK